LDSKGRKLKRGFLILILWIVSVFMEATPSYAETAVPVDKAAHFGISATATTTCSLIGKLVSGNKWASEGVCFLAVNSVGVIKEATDPYRGGQRDKTDLYANLAGSGFSLFAVSIGF
jgi:hypothetical protein